MTDPVQSQQRIGKYMIFAAWILLLGLLTLLSQNWLERGDNPNRQLARIDTDGPAEVVLQRGRGGHYVAPGFINGTPVRFLVDTGATDVNIPAEVADRIGLRAGAPIRAHTANGVITVYRTSLDSIRLGGIELNNVRASINPHMPGETILLGMSFMRDLELIQRGNTLTLRQL